VPSTLRSLIVTVVLAIVALVGTVSILDSTKDMAKFQAGLHTGLSFCTVVTAWFMMHANFAMYYARLYYDEKAANENAADENATAEKSYAGGLDFPGVELPDYWDFMYFSLTIAMCYQTSDVSATTSDMRRALLAHAVVSFFFVVFVIGVVAGVVQRLL
jgi:uncharacterized membrane protein